MTDATELLPMIIDAWHTTTQLEVVSVLFGLAYVILAARENIWCWPAALISTGTAVFLFWDASLLMESALNVYYLAMALVGWLLWRYGGKTPGGVTHTELAIQSWGHKQHLSTFALITTLTVISGYLLSQNTEAALPYIDSFTTWSAVITTWMVARKVLQNWLYWIVIDTISVWLYAERGLYLYSLLFIAYTIIAVFGYIHWRKKIRNAH